MQTAALLGFGTPATDERLGEVGKSWYDDGDRHDSDVALYLAGADLPCWEARSSAIERFDAALAENAYRDPSATTIVVTHGTVLSLWLHARGVAPDPVQLWQSLALPHVLRYDTL